MRAFSLAICLMLAGCIPEPAPVPVAPVMPQVIRPPARPPLEPLIIPERFVARPQRKAAGPKPPAAKPTIAHVEPTRPAPELNPPAPGGHPAVEVPIATVLSEPRLPATEIPALAGEPDPMLVPAAARPYQRMMLRESRVVFGITAPTALLGAQIQAESGWRPGAHSIYAAGLAQFIPATAEAMSRKYPELGGAEPLNPQWAIRAQSRYMRDLYRPIAAASECDRWAFTLSAYNGGPGWIPRDRALCSQHPGCDTGRWYGNVERYTSRSAANAQQNREYPKRIELQYQPSYRSWGGVIACRGTA